MSVENGDPLLSDLHAASGFWNRFIGLQFASRLPEGHGVLLSDCHAVHTFWMRFPIDVVFLDQSYRVVEIREAVRPWRIVTPQASSVRHVVEMNPGGAVNLRVGLETRFE
ncbi:MAG: DUF192 domain-containing protein [Planctomycetota bacterium]